MENIEAVIRTQAEEDYRMEIVIEYKGGTFVGRLLSDKWEIAIAASATLNQLLTELDTLCGEYIEGSMEYDYYD